MFLGLDERTTLMSEALAGTHCLQCPAIRARYNRRNILAEDSVSDTVSTMAQESTLAILRRLIDASQANLSKGAAEAVLQIQLTESDQARMTDLAARSN